MGFYRRSKLGYDFLVRNNNQIQNPPTGIGHHRSFFHTPPSFPQPNHQLTRRRRPPILQFCRNKLTISPFLFGSRKAYCSKSVPKDDKKWPYWKSHSIALGLSAIFVYYRFSETVPYSNRTRFVFISLSHNDEKMLSESGCKRWKETHKILREDDPQSVRVRLIAKNLLNVVQNGLGERIVVQSNDDYSCLDSDKPNSKKIRGNVEHMEVFDWEFFVVDDSCDFLSGCMPGGKIYICTGDLSHCETDADIAVILAHEIGHVVARHAVEQLSKHCLMRRLASTFKSTEKVIDDWFVHPLSRKHEIEADYIGMLLMASAGYDPLVTLIHWKKVMERFRDYSETYEVELKVNSTHPSNEERLEMLSRPKVMEEALRLYQGRINSNALPENQSPN